MFLSLELSDDDLGTHDVFLVALELLDPPHDSVLVGLVLGLATTDGVDLHVGGVGWHRDLSDDIGGEIGALEDRLQLHTVLDLV